MASDFSGQFSELKKSELFQRVKEESSSLVKHERDGGGGTSEPIPKMPKCEPSTSSGSSNRGTNAVLVHPRQKENLLLKSLTSVPWRFEEFIVPDYVMGHTTCALFLSLKYHNLNRDYINGRIKSLGKSYKLRVLLVLIDMDDPHALIKHLNRVCFVCDLTLMLAWNYQDAAKIIENYKKFEFKPCESIMEMRDKDPYLQLISALTRIKDVTRKDAVTLLNTFGSFKNICKASTQSLAVCSGIGMNKATIISKTLKKPFIHDPDQEENKKDGQITIKDFLQTK